MNATACDDRGADLFLVARGAPPTADLAAHLAACAGCRADLERLRLLARDLPSASAGLAPLPATRGAVMAEAALPPRAEAPPPPRRRGGGILRFIAPIAAVAAGVGLTVFVLHRGPGTPLIEGSVDVTAEWGGAALDGLAPGGLKPGAILSARQVAAIRVGPPVDAAVVLGPGTRLRLSGPSGGEVEILEGLAWFEPAPTSALKVRAGDLEVSGGGARFTVERRASGAATVCTDAGGAVVRAGGAEVPVTGPARVEVPAGGKPSAPAAADPADAAAWFARPEVLLERGPDGTLVVTLRAEIPSHLRVAPFDPFEPLFTLVAEGNGRAPARFPVKPEMLRAPAPAADADGAFLLSPSRSYRITVDGRGLALDPGTWSLSAVYAPQRAGGPWRGSRASKALEWDVK